MESLVTAVKPSFSRYSNVQRFPNTPGAFVSGVCGIVLGSDEQEPSK